MAVVRWLLVAVMAVVAAASLLHHAGSSRSAGGGKAGAALYYCPMHPQIVQDHPGECPICNMTLVPRPAGPVKPSSTMQPATASDAGASGRYYCPMHPWITSDDPNAKCDLCGGMKLVPRPTDASAPALPGLVPVDIPLDRVQKIGVRTARVSRQAVASELRTIGAVEASERGLAQISPRFSGWIEELLVPETGQRVKRGQVLATIYSPELLQAQQELLTAIGWSGGRGHGGGAGAPHGQLGAPEGLVADARQRLELLGVSPQEIDAIARSGKPRRALPLRSPVDGHVIEKRALPGMSVTAGTPLFQIADLSTVWVMADVYESDLRRVRVGQPARFEVNAYPGERFAGKVQFVYPTLDPGSRTLRVRLEFRNRRGPGGLQLRPGMYGNVTFDLPGTTALLVPAEAVVDTGDVQYVFVAREGGRFEPRRVKLGARGDHGFEVTEGLTEGEVVVTTANFLIDSESRLRAAIEGPRP
jgi:Cu(I)/Ag(I) efflux system membrane fusion protein